MKTRSVCVCTFLFLYFLITGAFAQNGPSIPRGPDGKPDFQGFWEVAGCETNQPSCYSIPDNTEGAIPSALGNTSKTASAVVDPPDGKIPYQAWALEKRKALVSSNRFADPEAHCFPSGIPRQTYVPDGFQILQRPNSILFLYEAFHASRVVPMDGRPHLPNQIKSHEGDSRGHWEGDTLVIDVTNLNGKAWLDMSGNFTTDHLHVIERYTLKDSKSLLYEAMLEDPTLYTRPWKLAVSLVRQPNPQHELIEMACYEGERDLQHYLEKDGGKQTEKK